MKKRNLHSWVSLTFYNESESEKNYRRPRENFSREHQCGSEVEGSDVEIKEQCGSFFELCVVFFFFPLFRYKCKSEFSNKVLWIGKLWFDESERSLRVTYITRQLRAPPYFSQHNSAYF